MGLGHTKIAATLPPDVAQHLHDVVGKVVRDSKFANRELVMEFATRMAASAFTSQSMDCWGCSHVLFSFREMCSQIRSLLDGKSVASLITVSKLAAINLFLPSVARAAGQHARKVWPKLLRSPLLESQEGLRTALRCVSLHTAGQWVDVIALLVGIIARLTICHGAEKAVDSLLPRAIRRHYGAKLGILERALLGPGISKTGETKLLDKAHKILPWLIQAEVQCLVRKFLASVPSSSQSHNDEQNRIRCCVRRPIHCNLHVPARMWRETWHPSLCAPLIDPNRFPHLCYLIGQHRAQLADEFDRLWNSYPEAFQGWERNPRWLLFGTHLFGNALHLTAAAAPIASWFADQTGATICGYSVLLPGAHIKPHSENAESACYRVHVGLRVPKKTGFGLRVEEQTAVWSEESVFVFDSNSVHEAWNFTDELRAVLLLDYGASQVRASEWPLWMEDAIERQETILEHEAALTPVQQFFDEAYPRGCVVKLQTRILATSGLPDGSRGLVVGSMRGPTTAPKVTVLFDIAPNAQQDVAPIFLVPAPDHQQIFRGRLCQTIAGNEAEMGEAMYIYFDISTAGIMCECRDTVGGNLHCVVPLVSASLPSLRLHGGEADDERSARCLSWCWHDGGHDVSWTLTFQHHAGASFWWHRLFDLKHDWL